MKSAKNTKYKYVWLNFQFYQWLEGFVCSSIQFRFIFLFYLCFPPNRRWNDSTETYTFHMKGTHWICKIDMFNVHIQSWFSNWITHTHTICVYFCAQKLWKCHLIEPKITGMRRYFALITIYIHWMNIFCFAVLFVHRKIEQFWYILINRQDKYGNYIKYAMLQYTHIYSCRSSWAPSKPTHFSSIQRHYMCMY